MSAREISTARWRSSSRRVLIVPISATSPRRSCARRSAAAPAAPIAVSTTPPYRRGGATIPAGGSITLTLNTNIAQGDKSSAPCQLFNQVTLNAAGPAQAPQAGTQVDISGVAPNCAGGAPNPTQVVPPPPPPAPLPQPMCPYGGQYPNCASPPQPNCPYGGVYSNCYSAPDRKSGA